MAVETSRCENRMAAHTTNGSARKASDTDIPFTAFPPKIKRIARLRDNHRPIASMTFDGGNRQERPVLQLKISGVMMIMPEASSFHQVQAFASTSDLLRTFAIAIGTT